MYFVVEGRATYGHSIGIIMQHDGLIRLPGDVGNLTTYSFPVTFRVLRDFPMSAMMTPNCTTTPTPSSKPPAISSRWVAPRSAAGCGFAALMQPYVAAAVDVPVVNVGADPGAAGQRDAATRSRRSESSPPTGRGLRPRRTTTRSAGRSDQIPNSPDRDRGGLTTATSAATICFGSRKIRPSSRRWKASMVRLAQKSGRRRIRPSARIVLECTNMPPFAAGGATRGRICPSSTS